jgi:hypothetical protein
MFTDIYKTLSTYTGTMRWQLVADHVLPVPAAARTIFAAPRVIANHDGRFETGRALDGIPTRRDRLDVKRAI